MSDLPPNVRAVADRHGKIRYRFRRAGWKSAYLPGKPGDADFHRAYAEMIEKGPAAPIKAKSPRQPKAKSIDDLVARMKAGVKWQKKKAQTRHVQGRILERFTDRTDGKGRRYGERPVESVTVVWLDKIFAGMADTPAAANVLRKVLSGLMDYAIKLNWRSDNPVRLTDAYEDGEGHHAWTEAEIAQYRKAHALGTMARLTLELALNTAARRCNVATLTRDDIRDGRITVDHAKGNNEATVPLLATTKAALDALPAAPIKHLVVTQFGKPFSIAGLGNRMRKWCNEAGLEQCSMHGLRKATSRRIAESGGTDAEGQAITGHRKAETFTHYRASANRAMLADRALSNVVSTFEIELSNQIEKD
ncbi:tyrosine-type recombinase/integrase [Novosphingobium sp. KN65.2]|uniref:tyrosine-type recombinase/integrase n=1 Tax=Novosphingobium sp. KN65.2 TaxID=1478134 RepID=UPI0005DC331C|nr:tyrosine-type recombinase/integrase [Novosphingobium sp. KN65.2]CDO34751.1 putative Phage integrase [Novosphingobium sp. KN65.2]